MAWIRTTPLEGEDEAVQKAMTDQRASVSPANMRSRCRSSTRACRGSSPRTP